MRSFFALPLLLFLASCNPSIENTPIQLPSSLEAGENEELARGYVYHDVNENGNMDSNETGISGVFVSNGVDLVQTDAEGQYSIPVSEDAIIFVIKPRDWMTPVNEENLPRFFYIHKPNGSPENFTYRGISPTGPLPDRIDFPLFRETGSEKFKMVVFGDPQPYSIEQIDFLSEDIIAELVNAQGLEFGITMGDIVGDNLDLFSPLNQAVSKIGIPWYNVLGNHDVNFMAPNDELSDDTFESIFGPATYAFVYGDVHFIVVDDVIHEDSVGSTRYTGGLRPDQFEFVSNYLSIVPKDDLIVVNMHIPLAQHGNTFRQSDQKKLFDLLKDFPNTLSISAHTHVHDHRFFHKDSSDWQREVPHHHFNAGTTSGSWWNGIRDETDVPHTMMRDGTPNGYSFITFNGTEYIIDWKVAGSPESHQMNIHVPRGIVANSDEATLLTVNFFNGSEYSELSYRVLGATDWQTMEKVNKADPYYAMISQRHENFQKFRFPQRWDSNSELADQPYPISRRMSRPQNSTHLWEANLGTDWPLGRHVIEVKAKDRYGRTYTAFQTMRVIAE